MKQIAIFVDVSNLYYCIGHRFGGRKLDYAKYREFITDLGNIVLCKAYGSQLKSEAHKFIKSLKCLGYDPVFKIPKQMYNKGKAAGPGSYKRKSDWDVGIAVDMITCINMSRPDMIVLGSADSDMEPVVRYVRNQGVKVVIFACGISSELYDAANECIEITESLTIGGNHEHRNIETVKKDSLMI